MKNSTLQFFTKRIIAVIILFLLLINTFEIAKAQCNANSICETGECGCAECNTINITSNIKSNSGAIVLTSSISQFTGHWEVTGPDANGTFSSPNSFTTEFTGTPGNKYSIKYVATNDICSIVIEKSIDVEIPPSQGNFNVGAAYFFKKLSDVFTYYHYNPVTGPLKIILTDNEYDDVNFRIYNVPGTSNTDTILVTSEQNTPVIYRIQQSTDYGINFYDASYVTIDGGSYGIDFTLKNCSTVVSHVISFTSLDNVQDRKIRIKNCTLNGCTFPGSCGIYIPMGSQLAYSNIFIENNTFNISPKGVTMQCDTVTLKNNKINDVTETMSLNCSDLLVAGNIMNFTHNNGYLNLQSNSFNFLNNRITKYYGGYCLYLNSCSSASANNGILANNSIYLNNFNNGVASGNGIYASYSTNLKFYYNTVVVQGYFPVESYTINLNLGSVNNTLINNNLVNNGLFSIFAFNLSAISSSSSNNNFSYSSFAASVQGTPMDLASLPGTNNISFKPTFKNDTCHVTKLNWFLDKTGTPLNGIITKDIDGEDRDPATPDIGADEFLGYPTASGNVNGIWNTDTLIVTDDINVLLPETLNIEAGTKVLFAEHNTSGNYIKFTINGTLNVNGIAGDSVYFLPIAGNFWNGITFNSTANSSSVFKYAVIKGVTTGLNILGANGLTFRNSVFHQEIMYPIIYADAASINIDNCLFENSYGGDAKSMRISAPTSGTINITGNKFKNFGFIDINRSNNNGTINIINNEFVSPKSILYAGSGIVNFNNNVVFYKSTAFTSNYQIMVGNDSIPAVDPVLNFYNNSVLVRGNCSDAFFRVSQVNSTYYATLNCTNSIIRGNLTNLRSVIGFATANFTYTNAYSLTGADGTGDFNSLPLFKDTTDGNYNLQISNASPCYNAGDPGFTTANLGTIYDYAGNPRISDSRIDIGAYEFLQFTAGAIRDTDICINQPVLYTANANKLGTLTYNWEANWNNTAWNSYSSEKETSIMSSIAGTVQLRCIIRDNSTSEIDTTNVANVIIHGLPVPTITGMDTVSGYEIASYYTQPGMQNYYWTITNGSIINGGTETDDYAIVQWQMRDSGKVSVNYNTYGCSAESSFVYKVVINPINFADGLVAWYPFSGNANDQSGNGNNGTTNGQILTKDRLGRNNSAYSFNSDVINCGNASSLKISGDISIALWVNTTLVGMQNAIMKKDGSYGYELGAMDSYGKLYFNIYDGTYKGAASSDVINDGAWHHIVAERQGSFIRIYTDGTLSNEYYQAGGIGNIDASAENLYISWGWKGKLDNVRIYSRALAANEVRGLYDLESAPIISDFIPDKTSPVCEGEPVTYFVYPDNHPKYKFYINDVLKQDSPSNKFIYNGIKTNDVAKVVATNIFNESDTMALSPVAVTSVPATSIIGETSICKNSTIAYSTQPGMDFYEWQVLNGEVTQNSNNATIIWNDSTRGVIRVLCNINGCYKMLTQNVTLNDKPTVTSFTNGEICGSGTVALGAVPSSGSIDWYDASTDGNKLGSGTTFFRSITSSGTYYAEANNGGCLSSTRTAVTASIKTLPTATVTPGSVCGSGTVNLSVSTTAPTINWYDFSVGTASQGTGNSFTTETISSTKTYYVVVTENGCSDTLPAVATVKTLPSVSGNSMPICGSGPATLTAITSAPVVNWYDVSTGGSSKSTNMSYTTLSIDTTTTFYVTATDNGCTSARIPVVANVTKIPTLTAVPGSNCGTGDVNLSVTTTAPNVNWFNVATGGSPIGNTTNFIATGLSTTTTFYAMAIANGCPSARIPVVATIKTIPTVSATSNSVCNSGTVTLSATASSGIINWYANNTGGSSLGTGTSFTTPDISTSTTYFVDATDNGCTSPVRMPAIANVYAVPTFISTNGDTLCGSGTATVSAIASAGIVSWFDAPTGGSLLATGSSYIISALSSAKTYYAEADNNGCISTSREAVNVVIKPMANVLTALSDTTCDTGNLMLEATVSAGNAVWYDLPTGGSPVYTGNKYDLGVKSVTDTLYVAASLNGCISSRVPVYAIVAPIPTFTISKSDDNVCPNIEITLTASSNSYSYEWVRKDNYFKLPYDIIKETNIGTGISKKVFTGDTPSEFYVTATSIYGCKQSLSAILHVKAPVYPVSILSNNPASLSSRGQIIIRNYEYYQILGSAVTTDSKIYVNGLDSGFYAIRYRNSDGCGIRSFYVHVGWEGPLSRAGFTYVIDSLGKVNFTNTSVNVDSIRWKFDRIGMSTENNPVFTFPRTGVYQVTLTAFYTNTSAGIRSVRTSTETKDIPVTIKSTVPTYSKFDYSVSADTVKFTNLSTNATTYNWTFGDGDYSTSANPTDKIYSKAGTYKVCLTVSNNKTGESNSSCKDIVIDDVCTVKASFAYTVLRDTVFFTNASKGQYDKYFWNFGDGGTSTEQNPSHKFTHNPSNVVLTVQLSGTKCLDSYGELVSAAKIECIADFENSVDVNDSVTFYNKSLPETNANYFWIFEPGNTSSDVNPKIKFSKNGLKDVTLTVISNSSGCSNTITKKIQVGKALCGAHFTYFVDTDTTAIFKNDGIGESTGYLWDFGDGTFSEDTAPNHKYAYQGYYTVKLNTFNKYNGCMDTYTAPILAGASGIDCEADFSYLVSKTDTVKFQDLSSGDIKSWTWDFGDRQPVVHNANPVHKFPRSGFYNVCLTVTNNKKVPNMTCKLVDYKTDRTSCFADFMFNVKKDKKEVTLVSKSSGNPTTFEWGFGDKTIIKKNDSASHVYNDTGYYLLSLHITTAGGCESFAYKLINIDKPNKLYAMFGYNVKRNDTKAGGYPVDFGGAGIGDNSRLRWNFGDGSENSTSLTPTHEYAKPGTYTVCLDYLDTVTQQSAQYCSEITTQDFCQDDSIKPYVECKDTTIVVLKDFKDIPTSSVIAKDSDDCAIQMRSLDNARFYPANEGENTIHVTVTDYNNNTYTCAAFVTVKTSNEVQMLNVTKGLKVYPNPVEKSAIIKYVIESPADIELALFDLSGKRVLTIFDGKQSGGQQTVNLDASSIMSGSYILQLKTSAGIVKRTMLVKK